LRKKSRLLGFSGFDRRFIRTATNWTKSVSQRQHQLTAIRANCANRGTAEITKLGFDVTPHRVNRSARIPTLRTKLNPSNLRYFLTLDYSIQIFLRHAKGEGYSLKRPTINFNRKSSLDFPDRASWSSTQY
jgi:hypothetical protein